MTARMIRVWEFNYSLDNGESLSSVKVGGELEYLRPYKGGPWRVAKKEDGWVELVEVRP